MEVTVGGEPPFKRAASSGLAKKVIAFAAFNPHAPSIIPGEKPALSRRTWSWTASGPVWGILRGKRVGAVWIFRSLSTDAARCFGCPADLLPAVAWPADD